MTTTVYVRLLDEAVLVWRPALAKMIQGPCYLLLPTQAVPESEVWEFRPGQHVTVEQRELSGGDVLVAVAVAPTCASTTDPGKAL